MTSVSDIRDAIRSSNDNAPIPLDVPEWSVKVGVRGMTGDERADFTDRFSDESGKVDWHSIYEDVVIASCVHPETGEPIFEPSDREWLMSKSGAVLDRIAKKALDLSGLGEKAVDSAGKFPADDQS